ncbi:Protein of unknown function [Vibrio xiamenensis]|uniref:Lipoprotein n=1 Tax=Vibrio xiamenensis TaxID=861298 RepID=A0A1G8BEE1_9VIBR|nr:DUF2799 domain-containing protein [Vibrio xiamenensis]SDH31595.1 Protein of unknown function [Vibrio xiamenensis]
MKGLILTAAVLVLAGCSAQQHSMPMANQNWQDFGYEQAMDGQAKQMMSSLSISDQMYAQYSDGYEMGRTKFCGQDAFRVGFLGKSYQGICDNIDASFHDEYQEGLWWDDGASLE